MMLLLPDQAAAPIDRLLYTISQYVRVVTPLSSAPASGFSDSGDGDARKRRRATYHRPAMSCPEPSPRPAPEPVTARTSATDGGFPGRLREIRALDVAVYAAISATPTPTLDRRSAARPRWIAGGRARTPDPPQRPLRLRPIRSASRAAVAMIVRAGFAAPCVGRALPSAM
jgi:hypothetical protein